MAEKCDSKVACKYGEDCYQKNPEHLKKYKHPKKRNVSDDESYPRSPKKRREADQEAIAKKENGFEEEEEEEVTVEEINKKIIAADLPKDVKERIKLLFLVEMPIDFYELYEFCKSISKNSPKQALKTLNLELVGPFDVLEGTLKNDFIKSEALIHYRYYYDPPEFQTVLKVDDEDQSHYGYFRDDPNKLPCFVAKNKAAIGPVINCVAGNIFGAVNVHAEELKSSADIFRKMKIQKIQAALAKWAKNNKISLDTVTPEIKSRRSSVVAKSFNTIGIVVPYDNKTEIGYRTLPVKDEELKTLLGRIASASTDKERTDAWSKLQPVITAASIANDECDFGTSLELGLDLFAFGEESLHTTIKQIMCITYKLLQRSGFGEILQAHLKRRNKNSNLSTIV